MSLRENRYFLALFASLALGLCAMLQARADEARALRVGLVHNAPIAFENEQGLLQGIYVDVLEEIARLEKWRVRYVPGTLAETLARLRAGEIDVAGGIAESARDDIYLHFSTESIAPIWAQVYVPAGAQAPSLLDLRGKSVAVARGDDGYARHLEDLCKAFEVSCQVGEVDSFQTVLELLDSRQVDAGVVNRFYGERHAAAYAVRAAPIVFAPGGLRLAALGGIHADVLNKFDLYVGAWRREPGSYLHQTLRRWSGPPPRDAAFRGVAWPWLAAGALLLFVLLWGGALLWAVKSRTRALAAELDTLRRSERQYRLLVDSVPYGLQEVDLQGTVVFSNTAEHQIRRYNAGELMGKSLPDMAASDTEKAEFQAYLRKLAEQQPQPQAYYTRAARKDGEIAEIRWEWNYKRNERGEVVGFFALVTDITEVRRVKAQILTHHNDLKKVADARAADLAAAYNDLLITAAVFENTSEAILVTDIDGHIQNVNPAFVKITGYAEADIQGQPLARLGAQKQGQKLYGKLWKQLREHASWQGEVWNQRKSGEVYPAWLSINAVRNANEQTTHYVALLSDITKRKQQEKQIWRQANYDALTGLPNRNLFHNRLGQAVLQAEHAGQRVALMFIDLDKFKEVNDTLGHDAGDELLKAATRRLAQCVRKSDTVARMGGDEFTVILPELASPRAAAEVARQILQQLTQPFDILGQTVHISGSVGIVVYPEDGDTLTALLKNADIAMYRIKESGRNGYCFFSESMQVDAARDES